MTTLDALRVLDLSDGIAGAFCAKLFAGYGADVIAVEPPAGNPLRRHGPYAGPARAGETGALWLYLGAGKRSLTLDIASRTGRTLFLRLVEDANVVVESFAPGRMAELGLADEDIQRVKQRIVVTSITPYGQTGPRSRWRATNLTSFASGGQMAVTGEPDREPLVVGGYQAEYQAGLHAFAASAIAAHNADGFEIPQHIDISAQECMLSSLELYLPWVLGFGREISRTRRGNVRSALVGIFPAADGQVGLHVLSRHWPVFARAIGHPELIDDERFRTERDRLQNDGELAACVYDWITARSAREVYETLAPQRIPVSTVDTIPDLLDSPHLRERAYFQTVDHPVAGEQTHPGPPARLPDIPWAPDRAPLLGEHTREILSDELGLTRHEITRLRSAGVT